MMDQMNAIRKGHGPWPKLLSMFCFLCLMAFQAVAQNTTTDDRKAADLKQAELKQAELKKAELNQVTYMLNGKPVEMSAEKLAWLHERIAKEGLDPAVTLKGTVELGPYLEHNAGVQTAVPLQTERVGIEMETPQ